MPVEPMPVLLDLPNELVGERVLMRPPRAGDGATVWGAVEESREQIAPWLPWVEKTLGPDDCEAAARRGAARWQTREDLMVSIWERTTGRYLGGSGLHRIDWGVPAFEIGYWLRTSAWGWATSPKPCGSSAASPSRRWGPTAWRYAVTGAMGAASPSRVGWGLCRRRRSATSAATGGANCGTR